MRTRHGERTCREYIPVTIEVPICDRRAPSELMRPACNAHVDIKSRRKVRAVCPVLGSVAEPEAAGTHVELSEFWNVSGIQALHSHFRHVEELGTLPADAGEIRCEPSRDDGRRTD